MALRRILIVSNYLADHQQSMIRFAHLLVSFYEPYGDVCLASPPVLFGLLPGLPLLFRKYLAYIDKLVLFPLWLLIRSRTFETVHISDHGNAYYAFCCSSSQCIITCHDLLAVRGAMGDSSTACIPSPIGTFLQRLIVSGLRRANLVTFVSHSTLDDFIRIVGTSPRQGYAVIPNSLNAPFTANLSSLSLTPHEKDLIPELPFLLMVGSAHPRKNRRLALRLLLELGSNSPYVLVFAGEPLSSEDKSYIIKHQLTTRVKEIINPSHDLLNHLYGLSHALIFPSLAEGFGWPLIEAQACGCPVIASNTTSIPEVAGDAALYATPHDVPTFVAHVISLEDPAFRINLIQKGTLNIRRFDTQVISRSYVDFAFPSLSSSF